MPIKDFLKKRKQIKSPATFMEKLVDGKWIIDPDDPKKLDWRKYDHSFKERPYNRIFNRDTEYFFLYKGEPPLRLENQELTIIHLSGRIPAASTEKWRDASKELIHYVIDKWGGADKVWLLKSKEYEPGHEYQLVLYCKRGDNLNLLNLHLIVRVPVKWESSCVGKRKIGKYWCVLKEKTQRNLSFFMTIKIANLQEKDIIHSSENVLSKAEQDKILKEAGYFEILKQATDKHKK